METEPNNSFKNYLQLLPYVSGLIILISIIKAITFYNVFGIRIVTYLDLSECILIFLDQLLLIAIALVTSFGFTIILFGKNLNRRFLNIYDQKTFHTINKKKYWLFIILFVVILLIYSLFQYRYYPLNETIIISISFALFFIFPPLLPLIFQSILHNYTYKIVLITGFSITYLGAIINIGLHDAYKIKYGMTKQEVNLTFKTNENINTSDTLVYIGSTRNYYFFFNPNTMKKTIFMKSELTKLSIQ